MNQKRIVHKISRNLEVRSDKLNIINRRRTRTPEQSLIIRQWPAVDLFLVYEQNEEFQLLMLV